MDRGNVLDHISDFVRICNDHLIGLLLAEVGEFLHHLLCRVQIKRRLSLILEAVSGLNDGPVYRILRIQEMNVTGRNARLAEIIGETHDFPVDFPKLVERCDSAHMLPHHVLIVPDRLDLKIIVKVHDFGDLRRRLFVQYSMIKFAGRACRTDHEPVPVFHEQGSGDPRPLLKISEMRLGNERVQVASSGLVLCKQDNMVIGQVPYSLLGNHPSLVQIRVCQDILLLHSIPDLQPRMSHGLRTVLCPLRRLTLDLERLAELFKCSSAHMRHEIADTGRDIDDRPLSSVGPAIFIFGYNVPCKVRLADGFLYERRLIFSIVRDQRHIPRKGKEALHGRTYIRCFGDHIVIDLRLSRKRKRKRPARINQRCEPLREVALLDLLCGYLHKIMSRRTRAGGNNLENDDRIRSIPLRGSLDKTHHIVDQISFAAVDDLEVRIFLVGRMVCFGKGLNNTVVGDSQSLHSPAFGLLYDILG